MATTPQFLPAVHPIADHANGLRVTRPWLLYFQNLLTQVADAGDGDVTGPGLSINNEIVLFSGTTGKVIKRATGTGYVFATSGVYSVVADPAIIKVSTSTVTDAAFKTLPTTPVTLLPVAGSGWQYVVVQVQVAALITTGYTNINGDAFMNLAFNGTEPWSNFLINDSTIGTTRFSDAFAGAGSRRLIFVPYTPTEPAFDWGNVVGVGDTAINGTLALTVDNNGSGNFTGGNSANHFVVTTYYATAAVS